LFEFLEGTLASRTPTEAVIDVGGVGYALEVSLRTSEKISALTSKVRLWVHHRIADDRFRLFGFADTGERELFRALISISGVGPASALALLSGHDPDRLWELIRARDSKTLARTRGIGPKTAERVCVELADRAQRRDVPALRMSRSGAPSAATSTESDAIAALEVLGYNDAQASKAVAKSLAELGEGASLEQVVRLALKSTS
jgi:Holliday junction DNA helicase RuvA